MIKEAMSERWTKRTQVCLRILRILKCKYRAVKNPHLSSLGKVWVVPSIFAHHYLNFSLILEGGRKICYNCMKSLSRSPTSDFPSPIMKLLEKFLLHWGSLSQQSDSQI